jgi:predicted phage terminase large subunit-like protein
MKLEAKQAIERYKQKLSLIKSGATVNPFENAAERQAVIDRAKSDIGYFVSEFFPHYATSESADFQIDLAKRVLKNKKCRYLVRWGRGLAKSVWCDVIIPLFLWINGEDVYMVIIGNNEAKAKQLLSDIQAEFEANAKLIHYFGEQKLAGSWADGDFETKDGRFIGQALGMGQSPRGLRKKARRPNLIVPDDLEDRETIKNPKRQDEIVTWLEKDVIPTMDGETRRYLHPNNDFAPRTIQNQLEKKHPVWKVHLVKAYDKATYKPRWHQKYSTKYYKEVEEDIGILAAYAEYLHEPHVEGKVFRNEQIQWKKLPALNHFEAIVGHWDIAYAGNDSSDYNAVRVWGLYEGEFYYIDSFVRQSKMKEAIEWMVDFQQHLPDSVSVHWRFESQFWNDEVRRTIKEVETELDIILGLIKVDTPKKKKYERILKLQPYYQNGRIWYNEKKRGHNFTQTGIVQLLGIEPGYRTHDDAPDADEQAIGQLEKHNRRGRAGGVRTGKSNKNKNRRA